MRDKFLLFFLWVSLLSVSSGFAEGTKELMPNENDPTRILLSTQTGRDPFAINNGSANYRLYIHISDAANEVIYFGVGQLRNNGNNPQSGSLVYNIYKPDQKEKLGEYFGGLK